MRKFLTLFITFWSLMTVSTSAQALDPENTLYIDLKGGRVIVEMFPDVAPNHVARIKELARKGFYDGVVFHRVITGFMAQTGDPTGTGMGGSGQKINAEFNAKKHVRGTVSMARAGDPNSADSQFFICFDNASFLDSQYTAWGQVVGGMEFVDAIKKGDPNNNGKVTDPDKVLKVQVAADADKAVAPAAAVTAPAASAVAPAPAAPAAAAK